MVEGIHITLLVLSHSIFKGVCMQCVRVSMWVLCVCACVDAVSYNVEWSFAGIFCIIIIMSALLHSMQKGNALSSLIQATERLAPSHTVKVT